ncbi:hypothetical protein A33Q_1399 [Indibacter alkaliphilus LW1]|uniref:Uncharacterized protein n=1 Tax=Indibacter alkaliphilus (strain CCUG 57479 / KCTC 22604 / LW1) TaxID=1189612 RepID=S2DND8_INDAL|nr:hypothetical protein [Indibacter alkaliphilus]EOZ98745.1 hypothetical protein A33Q_1399 [Indibacter alkaliphilus LW1]
MAKLQPGYNQCYTGKERLYMEMEISRSMERERKEDEVGAEL